MFETLIRFNINILIPFLPSSFPPHQQNDNRGVSHYNMFEQYTFHIITWGSLEGFHFAGVAALHDLICTAYWSHCHHRVSSTFPISSSFLPATSPTAKEIFSVLKRSGWIKRRVMTGRFETDLRITDHYRIFSRCSKHLWSTSSHKTCKYLWNSSHN